MAATVVVLQLRDKPDGHRNVRCCSVSYVSKL